MDMATAGHGPSLSEFPPAVYVPCHTDGETGDLRVSMRRTLDDRVALLAYTALDRLRAGAGADTPWALLTVEDLQRIRDESRYDVIYTDLYIPEDRR